ncbi:MAG: GyrI-like domain-containing protein [Muribaculaceae bacterium]|nr:GyrI-like domain-containing protein [Muribaculaceae bacterium]
MAFDYKKEYKNLYMPKTTPVIVDVPEISYIAVSGRGNPNEADGEYQKAIGMLYPVAYTLKMSHKTDYRMEGFFEYVVPPLESLWWTENANMNDFTDKSAFNWIAMIRVPDFVKADDVEWAKREVIKKKHIDCVPLRFFSLQEGLCAQIMHIGPYDTEPTSLAAIDRFIQSKSYLTDISKERRHHEIYLSDPRKCNPDKMKTVLRIPIVKLI